MIIKSISIKNFKSIEEINLDIQKYGSSYTRMLVGINESGKSNLLEAISYFNVPQEEFNYDDIHNQKDENDDDVELCYDIDFENQNTYLNAIKKDISIDDFPSFKLSNIKKNIYLEKGSNVFQNSYEFDVSITDAFFIKITKQQNNTTVFDFSKNEEEGYIGLTEEIFRDNFDSYIDDIIERYEPRVSFWEPSDEYLLSSHDLNQFKSNINSNKPLRNIFSLSGYNDDKIVEEIDSITNEKKRSKLVSKLNDSVNKYIKNIWKHGICVIIEITRDAHLSFLIKDDGKNNEHERFRMSDRSEGAKHFFSLIMSLSIESNSGKRKNQLILIDEPEIHLHPSGIRDMREELLRIGKNNYLFVSTHSPFLIDKKHKNRNIIIKKNERAITVNKEIKADDDILGDEVLMDAFGLNVYKDLLNPHRILLEGASDKKILDKLFQLYGLSISSTNGCGSNIVSCATRLNHNDVETIVIVDDDEEGRGYKKKILKIGGVYKDKKVYTIRDLIPDIKEYCTIEDLLGKSFIEGRLKGFYKDRFAQDIDLDLIDKDPFIEQIKVYLKRNDKYSGEFLEDFKIKISDEIQFNKNNLGEKFPFLNELLNKIKKILHI
jgi:predicted ATP-dependent endonuclease of OLD family